MSIKVSVHPKMYNNAECELSTHRGSNIRISHFLKPIIFVPECLNTRWQKLA